MSNFDFGVLARARFDGVCDFGFRAVARARFDGVCGFGVLALALARFDGVRGADDCARLRWAPCICSC